MAEEITPLRTATTSPQLHMKAPTMTCAREGGVMTSQSRSYIPPDTNMINKSAIFKKNPESQADWKHAASSPKRK